MKIITFLLLFGSLILINTLSYSQTVTIGNQVWMTKNLNVDTFRNGDKIPEAKTDAEWQAAGNNQQPAWCYYNNDPTNGAKYGKLYNWFAVNDLRGLAPEGYHIPTDAEWTILIDYLGGEHQAGTKIKSKEGWQGWPDGAGNGNNSSRFNGLPGGSRNQDGSYQSIGELTRWLSSTEEYYEDDTISFIWSREMTGYTEGNVGRSPGNKLDGNSVRCIKD